METIGLIGMEGRSRDCIGYQEQVAPFVAKTYQMVDDPRSDSLIRWGKKNNSFHVLDPSDFAQFLLPSYFKHRNFCSFIRQLNTYGFRKVDPDRWEFAHESFLKGQTHLLPFITRRRRRSEGDLHGSSRSEEKKEGMEGEEERALLQELDMLRQEQMALDEELEVMSKRLQATERWPHELMSFLVEVAEDPDLLPRLVRSKKRQLSMEKKRCLFASHSFAAAAAAPIPADCGLLLPSNGDSAIEKTTFNPFENGAGISDQREQTQPLALASDALGMKSYDDSGISSFTVSPQICDHADLSASQISFQPEFGPSSTSLGVSSSAVAFPFSLLEQGFF